MANATIDITLRFLSNGIMSVNEVRQLHGLPPMRDSSSAFMTKDRSVCAWCGSHASDDERGNCGACGAPRDSEE